MKKPIYGNKTVPIILMSTCAVFIASLFLSQSQFVTNISLNLSESFVILGFICAILILFEVLYLAIDLRIEWIDCHIYKNNSAKSNPVLSLLSIASFLLCIGLTTFFFNSVTTEGYYSNVEKCIVHNSYYIKTDNMLLEVDKNDYDKTVNGKDYVIEFKYNKLIPNQYRITEISKIGLNNNNKH